MKLFRHEGVLYMRVVPAKALFRSTMVHDVVNRGNIFAVRLSDQALTIIPGTAQVEHLVASLTEPQPAPAKATPEEAASARARLAAYREALRNPEHAAAYSEMLNKAGAALASATRKQSSLFSLTEGQMVLDKLTGKIKEPRRGK